MEKLRRNSILGLMAFTIVIIPAHRALADNPVVGSYVLLDVPDHLSVNDNDDNHDEKWDMDVEPLVGEQDTVKVTLTVFSAFSDGQVTVNIDYLGGAPGEIEGFWPGTLTIDNQSPRAAKRVEWKRTLEVFHIH
jgi:hypothetical protein